MGQDEVQPSPTIQQEFWQNPYRVPSGLDLPKEYVEYCKPAFYLFLKPVSDYVVKVIKEWGHKLWLGKPEKEISILELGCNSGRNIDALLRVGYKDVRGIEINPECFELSKTHFPRATEFIDIGSIEELLPAWGEVDLIFTQGVFMHIPHENMAEIAFYAGAFAGRIITIEHEEQEWRNIKFARNYRHVFERLGMKQLHREDVDVPYISKSVLRVFDN